ncbi:phage terminase large subunit family protein [Lachnotalea glycerini]|uniref:Phage terminase large subunit family protein n=1 Tax=Lachnotalea glycerini TaxID=1763509 RepID=A0A371JC20_9FIRM|nr:phage terminase large subunit family protein [Lachnotalea glycerini]RDY30301.1 phage terminase large subunit family protein [Lachnotalea glycerini]
MVKSTVEYNTIQLFVNIAKTLSPPPILKVSEWADRYRKLSAESSAEPGQWNTNRAPYQREIMNALNNAECEEVVIMSSAQVGKTELILNIIGYYIDYDPSPMLCMQPTLDMAQTFSKDRLAPMLRDSPTLKGKVKDVKSRDSGNTILHKKFPGGQITMVGANSAQGLASRPIKIVLMDEIDRYPASAGTEGNPIKLAEKRTTTFWNRKKIKVSTPTIKGISAIEKEYNTSSKEEWNVPCPCCERYQPYQWGRIHFEDVTMECQFCGERFKEIEWKENNGKFIAQNPDRRKKRGFHLNEMASPWKTWEEIIEDFKEAKKEMKEHGDVEKMKVWINTSLGETWEEKGDSADNDVLLSRREMYKADIPEGVVLLTAGVDVQDDRFEIEITGWGKGYESWGILYKKMYGDLEKTETWDKLEKFLETEFYFINKNSLLIASTCIDTGGHFTTQCYKWLKQMERKQKRIFGIKGMGGAGIPLINKISSNNVEKVRILILGVDSGKEVLMTRLKTVDQGPGYCHFPINADRGYNETYIKGLTSEQRVIHFKDGRPILKWVKKSGTRNEPLDLRNYSTAAAEILKPDFEVLEAKIKSGINYMKKSDQIIKKKKKGIANGGIQL